MPSLHFFTEFGIPWILKWEPEVGYTQQNLPCIKRVFYTKFWKRMLRKNAQGVLEGQEPIDNIQEAILCYKRTNQVKAADRISQPVSSHIKEVISLEGSYDQRGNHCFLYGRGKKRSHPKSTI